MQGVGNDNLQRRPRQILLYERRRILQVTVTELLR